MSYCVYILANKNNNVIYTGVTNDITRRLLEHKSGTVKGFTQKYNVNKLVYCESYDNVYTAIEREKQIKRWTRAKKNFLIERVNPDWQEIMP